MSQCYVLKQMVNVIAYTIKLWMHLGGLLNTQEARDVHNVMDALGRLLSMKEA